MMFNKFFYYTIILSVLITTACYGEGQFEPLTPKKMHWPFEGMSGKFDRQSLQRGYKVFKDVCGNCHAASRLAFRNLKEIGFSNEEVKEIAKSYEVEDGPNDQGEMFKRPGKPSDYFVKPFANAEAAKAANNGTVPPDLSLITKAREDGENYVYSLLTGFGDEQPADFHVPEGSHYNPYFSTGAIAMSPPLSDDIVQFDDGTSATVDQMSYDVVNFLQWAAEPEMEYRKALGFKVLAFLLFATIIFFIAKKRVWSQLDDDC